MSTVLGLDHKVFAVTTVAVSTGVAVFSTYKWLSERRRNNEDNVYESEKLLNEYLVFHYGAPSEVLKWDFGPKDALEFPKRCADVCLKHCQKLQVTIKILFHK